MSRRQFFFVHVHKTAGTSLMQRLQRHFEPSAIYPDATDGDPFSLAPQISVAQLLERWEQRRHEIEIVTGHFPLATIELLGAEFVTLTVLREPVDRVISALHRYRERTPAAREHSLEAIYDEAAAPIAARNHMVKMFALTADEIMSSRAPKTWAMLTPLDPTTEHLVRAREQLSRVDVFGLQGRFEEFCHDLELRFGWRLGSPIHANRTATPSRVSNELRARIMADNALDSDFFQYARDLYMRRLAGRS